MLKQTLQALLNRDLTKLKSEIEQYPNEAALWTTQAQIANSGGNLCLHLLGNLNTYIGKELGNTGYVRNRDLEFAVKNVPRQELILGIENTISIVNETLQQLNEEVLEREFPVRVFDQQMSTGYFLVHLATHLAYHLGQINYHRRLVGTNGVS
jgi:hypothetical protein